MASGMIHYAISNKISEQITVKERNRFLLGASLLPDASSHEDSSYDRAHYWKLIEDRQIKGSCWEQFYEEYKDSFWSDDIYLGYYCHLMQDTIWFHDVVDPYVRIYPKEIKQRMYAKGYDDYARLNYLLVQEFSLSNIHFEEMDVPFDFLQKERIQNAMSIFDQWFDAKECSKADLELYKWKIINEYIEKCIDICCNQIKALQQKVNYVHSIDFFVKA